MQKDKYLMGGKSFYVKNLSSSCSGVTQTLNKIVGVKLQFLME